MKILHKIFYGKSKSQRGYLLIEAMVAISILIIGFLGILRLTSYSLSLNRIVSDQFTANFLAMEGIELTRNLIGHNVLEGSPWNNNFKDGCFDNIDYNTTDFPFNNSVSCLYGSSNPLKYDLNNGLYDYNGNGKGTDFYRTIRIDMDASGDFMKVSSIVKWTNRAGDFEINAQDYFFNWY